MKTMSIIILLFWSMSCTKKKPGPSRIEGGPHSSPDISGEDSQQANGTDETDGHRGNDDPPHPVEVIGPIPELARTEYLETVNKFRVQCRDYRCTPEEINGLGQSYLNFVLESHDPHFEFNHFVSMSIEGAPRQDFLDHCWNGHKPANDAAQELNFKLDGWVDGHALTYMVQAYFTGSYLHLTAIEWSADHAICVLPELESYYSSNSGAPRHPKLIARNYNETVLEFVAQCGETCDVYQLADAYSEYVNREKAASTMGVASDDEAWGLASVFQDEDSNSEDDVPGSNPDPQRLQQCWGAYAPQDSDETVRFWAREILGGGNTMEWFMEATLRYHDGIPIVRVAGFNVPDPWWDPSDVYCWRDARGQHWGHLQ